MISIKKIIVHREKDHPEEYYAELKGVTWGTSRVYLFGIYKDVIINKDMSLAVSNLQSENFTLSLISRYVVNNGFDKIEYK
jgi:hypothetical protein